MPAGGMLQTSLSSTRPSNNVSDASRGNPKHKQRLGNGDWGAQIHRSSPQSLSFYLLVILVSVKDRSKNSISLARARRYTTELTFKQNLVRQLAHP